MDRSKTPEHIRIDERNHVEKPLLDQLAGLQWDILDLDKIQTPQQTFRDNFTEVVMRPMLREQLKIINPWLEDAQGRPFCTWGTTIGWRYRRELKRVSVFRESSS